MHKLKILVGLIIFTASNVFSQADIKFSETEFDDSGIITFVKIATENKIIGSDTNIKILLNQLLKNNDKVKFTKIRSYEDNFNYTHFVYQAYYDNVEIYNMVYSIHVRDNCIITANGSISKIEIQNTSTKISELQALTYASLFHKNLTKNNVNFEAVYKNLVFIKSEADTKFYSLAYKILIEDNIISNSCFLYVDAHNGSIIYQTPLMCSVHKNNLPPPNALGSSQTKYSGTQSITTDVFNGGYRLREVRSGVNVITKNANNVENGEVILNTSTDFFDNNNTWLASVQNIDQPATDAHWAIEKILDYWRLERGRNSYDNQGAVVNTYVHFGSQANEAYWTGTSVKPFNSILLGDGYGIFSPLTSLDVCAHEFAHGVSKNTSGFLVDISENAVLNEGFSDIWAATIEAWAAPNKQKWLIGEEVTLIAPYFLRSMSNPPSSTLFGQATVTDTYKDAVWNSTNVIHYKSGVINKWYYLLCEGGTGTNGIGLQYNVNGIGMEKGATIANMTMLNLNSTSNINQARNRSIDKTREFYGIGSCEEIAVTNAWSAVNVGAGYVIPQTFYNIVGESEICNSSQFSVSGLLSNTTVVWSSSNTSIATVATTNNVATVTRVSNGAFQLTAVITYNACGIATETKTVTKNITIGNINNIIISEISNDCNEVTLTTNNTSSFPITWVTNEGSLINYGLSPLTTNASQVLITPPSSSCALINVSYTDAGCIYKNVNPYYFCSSPPWNGVGQSISTAPSSGEPLIFQFSEGMEGAVSYDWYINGNFHSSTGFPQLWTYTWPCVDGNVDCHAILSNGCHIVRTAGSYSPICYFRYSSNINIFPNPAINKTTITIKDYDKQNKINLTTIKQIKIIDHLGNIKLQIENKLKNNSITFDVTALKNEVYYVIISDGIVEHKLPLIIKH